MGLTIGLMGLIGLLVGFIAIEGLWLLFRGTPVPRPTIPRGAQTIGHGPVLRFAVLGDSTSISQGGDYQQGYAVAAAKYLARDHQVRWQNVGVPGARAHDIRMQQLPQVLPERPDVVLVAVGANDVTHLTDLRAVRRDLAASIAKFQQSNPAVQIILTGSPDMGSPPRLPQPLRWVAGLRTIRLNAQVQQLADGQRVRFAPIAARTGAQFRQRHELFAADQFHPDTAGYQLWIPVILEALQ